MTPNTEGDPIQIQADVSLGVCYDVCIPVEVSINAELPKRLVFNKIEISAALDLGAEEASVLNLRASCDYSKGDDGISIGVEVMGEMEFNAGSRIFIEYPGEGWLAQKGTMPSGQTLKTTALFYTEVPDEFAGEDVRLSVLHDDRIFEFDGC